MPRYIATFALGLAACAVPAGQKVTVLLQDRTVACEVGDDDEAPVTGTLELFQEDDFYQAELIETTTGRAVAVPSVRDGVTVTFTCPSGISEFIVRHATVIQSKRDEPNAVLGEQPVEAPAP